jgi:hypothetical protein
LKITSEQCIGFDAKWKKGEIEERNKLRERGRKV